MLEQSRQNDSLLKFYLFTFVAVSIAGLWWMYRDGMVWNDFPTHWRICAYTLRGIDTYALRGSEDFLPEIGYIYSGFHASPWGCLLQNICFGGFLSFEGAKIYFLAVNALVLIAASCLLSRKIAAISPGLSVTAFVMSLLSTEFYVSVRGGNIGGVICAFLVMAWLLCDDHPYISGILIAFAMIKPQVALIVCIAMLLMRKIKPLVTGAIIDISAWGIVSLMTGNGMIELLREFMFMSNPQGVKFLPFAGIFTLLIDDFFASILMSMLAGIIFVVVLFYFLPKNMPEMFKMYPAFMAVTFWSYSYANDRYVMILPALLCFFLMLRSSGTLRVLWLICGMWCSFALIIWTAMLYMFMFLNPALSYEYSAKVCSRTVYELVVIVIGIFICVELRRIYGEAKL